MAQTKTKKLSMREAAEKLLTENKGPMKAVAITDTALEKGLIKTSGKTPAATMQAILGIDAKKKDATFIRTAPGTYGLKGRDRKGQKAKEPAAA